MVAERGPDQTMKANELTTGDSETADAGDDAVEFRAPELKDVMRKLELLEVLVRRCLGSNRVTKAVALGVDVSASQDEVKSSSPRDDAMSGARVEGRILRWITDKGFGFAEVAGIEAFMHVSRMPTNLQGLKERFMFMIEKDAMP